MLEIQLMRDQRIQVVVDNKVVWEGSLADWSKAIGRPTIKK